MRKYCLLFCTALLCALLCTGCAVSLTDALPPLDDAATKLQNVTSVTVCRHTDDAQVMLTDIDELILSGETTFYYDGYAYNALRGGADLFYFESLFAE